MKLIKSSVCCLMAAGLFLQTACSGSTIAQAIAVVTENLIKAEATVYPQDAQYLAAASACAADVSGLFVTGAPAPTAAQVLQASSECVLSVPSWPGEPTQVSVILAAVGSSLSIISGLLPAQPAAAARRGITIAMKMKRPHFSKDQQAIIDSNHAALVVLKGKLGR